jgi:hypothetical protein
MHQRASLQKPVGKKLARQQALWQEFSLLERSDYFQTNN